MSSTTAPQVAPPWWRYAPALLSLGAAIWLSRFAGAVEGGQEVVAAFDWAPEAGVTLAFRLDGLSFAFGMLITAVGALVFLYAAEYFKSDRRLGRLMALLLIFEIAMLGLVLADDIVSLFVFWEATTITSYLLVGFDHHKAEARAKALQALLVTGAGGLALLAGLLLLADTVGSFRLSELAGEGELLRGDPLYPAFFTLIVIGCFTKSAQFPFHFWLPGAMAAPTPVSAYLHSATMVKAGVYLLARLTPELGGTELWVWTLTLFGGATMLIGAVWALKQTDLKLMLAWTTVSGLGSLVMFLGGATRTALVAAATFLVVHAFYKAALFLAIGVLDKKAGSRELDQLGGLGRAMPITWAVAMVAAFSMAGFPPLLGFIGKELKYEGALAVASEPVLVAAVAVLANALMAAMGLVIALRPFTGARRAKTEKPGDPNWALLVGPMVLASASLAFGLAPDLLNAVLVQPMARAIVGEPIDVTLKLWHGVNVPLLLSILTFALGAAAYLALGPLRAGIVRLGAVVPRAEAGYELFYRGLREGAPALARRMQPGRLTFYLKWTMATLAGSVLIAVILAAPPTLPDAPSLSVLEIGVLALTAIGALAAPLARSRLAALTALGVVGAGVAAIFGLYGAVDVAMTQLLVETLVVVVFAAALGGLPALAPARRDGSAILISGAVGVAVTLAVLAALEAPFDRRVTDFFEAAAWPEAYGRNVVNVILVDFRALDTFGEIAVVATAAVAALAALARRRA